MGPPFYFTIEPMEPHKDAPKREGWNGRWLPPQALGNNLKVGPPLRFHHDGMGTRAVEQFPDELQHFRTFSLYHDQAVIWTVEYDATKHVVGDGRDLTAAYGAEPRSDNDSGAEDWATLSFVTKPSGMSFAGEGFPDRCLSVEGPNQTWADQLLPDTYRADAGNDPSYPYPYGGLCGKLPLLLGLAALTMPAESVNIYMPQVVRGPLWQILGPSVLPRRAGWKNKRGLVVAVHFHPGSRRLLRSAKVALEEYEKGRDGSILP